MSVTIVEAKRCYWKFCVEANTVVFLVAEEAHPVIHTDVVINPTCALEAEFRAISSTNLQYGACGYARDANAGL
jgi:hypothetical protein